MAILTAAQRVAARYIPTGAIAEVMQELDVIVYRYDDDRSKPCARAFVGTAVKPLFRFSFGSAENRERYLTNWRSDFQAGVNAKANYKAQQAQVRNNALSTLEVGTLLYSSWGYDQTNIDFYQVVEIVGKSARIRAIAQRKTQTGSMSGTTIAIKDHFIGEPMLKRIQASSSRVYFRIESFASASPWDGQPLGWSNYA